MRKNPSTSPSRRRLSAGLLVLISTLPAPALAAPEAGKASEQWYVISLGGQPVGSVQDSSSQAPEGVRTASRMTMVINRLGARVEIESASSALESPSGRLQSAGLDLKMSSQTTSTTAEVGEGVVKIRTQAGGQGFERTAEFSGELLGPEALRRLTRERLAKPGDSLQIQTFSPELAAVVTVTRTAVGSETIESEGHKAQALLVEEAVSGNPGKRSLWLDAEGRVLASEEPSPFGTVRVFRADAATARLIGREGGELPAEIYSSTIVRTQIRLPDPRRIEWLKLRLLHRNPDLGWPDFDRPGQKVVEKTERDLVLEISRPRPVHGLSFPVPATDANREYLEPNAWIQSADPKLRAQALEIIGDEKDLFRAVLKLERWVAENMNFDLGIAMAPSTEIFENRRGTCVGYATLLTTLARAAGIPARFVMGFAYLDGMFAGHAWAEVLAGNEWLPVDAAVVAPGTADAARFAFVSTSLKEGPGAISAGAPIQLFGQIDIRLLGYALEGGEHVAVAEDAKPYSVAGDVYRNQGLGIELRKPERFQFVDLDSVWPETTLVGLTDGNGSKVTLQSRSRWPWEDAEAAAWSRLETVIIGNRQKIEVAGRPAFLIENPRRSAVAIPGPGVVWVLKVEGPEAGALMRQIAAGLRM